jgi:TPR repeat protein
MGMLYLSSHVEDYRLTASQGLDDAQFRLGQIDVIDQDVSYGWYRQAAEQGHPEACWSVAIFLLLTGLKRGGG